MLLYYCSSDLEFILILNSLFVIERFVVIMDDLMRNFYYYDVFCDKDSIKFGLVILLEFFYVGFERI